MYKFASLLTYLPPGESYTKDDLIKIQKSLYKNPIYAVIKIKDFKKFNAEEMNFFLLLLSVERLILYKSKHFDNFTKPEKNFYFEEYANSKKYGNIYFKSLDYQTSILNLGIETVLYQLVDILS